MKHSILAFTITALCLSACASKGSKAKTMGLPDSLPQDWRQQNRLVYTPQNSGAIPAQRHQDYYNNAKETSLWNSSPQSLFGDRRASQAGDILTVVIEIDDEAEIQNSITESRNTDEGFGIGSFFGLPELANKALPTGASLTPAIDITRDSQRNGNGSIRRGEKITLRLAAQVTGIMPNGHLSVAGKQEIMVNNEVRYLQVTGLIRKQDISRLNTITYEKMADARIYYGGQGNITNTVKPRKGPSVINSIIPF